MCFSMQLIKTKSVLLIHLEIETFEPEIERKKGGINMLYNSMELYQNDEDVVTACVKDVIRLIACPTIQFCKVVPFDK